MLHRIGQFIHALTAKMEPADRQFVNQILSEAEQKAFYAMDTNSQKHSVLVAKTCVRLAGRWANVDLSALLRGALLHDIGKLKGDMGTADRVLIVAVNKLWPRLARWLAQPRGGAIWQGFGRPFYIHSRHSELGCTAARSIGVEEKVLQLISGHHSPPSEGEPLELTLLRQADNLH
ncbi:MAG TPA: HD domain-containing protein [Bacillota bacterium]|nr:HD domain-containing protein [Bacillota bacterium]